MHRRITRAFTAVALTLLACTADSVPTFLDHGAEPELVGATSGQTAWSAGSVTLQLVRTANGLATFEADWTGAAPFAWDARPLDPANGPKRFSDPHQSTIAAFNLVQQAADYDAKLQVWEKLPGGGYNSLGVIQFTVPGMAPGGAPTVKLLSTANGIATFEATWAGNAPFAWDARPLDPANGGNVHADPHQPTTAQFDLPQSATEYDVKFQVWERSSRYHRLGSLVFTVPAIGSTTPPTDPVSTAPAQLVVSGQDLGLGQLEVVSAHANPVPVVGGTATLPVSVQGIQLLLLQDTNSDLRGLTLALPTAGGPTVVPADAESTAISLLMLTPGLMVSSSVDAFSRIAAIQSLTCFSGLVSHLRAGLGSTNLQSLLTTPATVGILEGCVDEYFTSVAPITGPEVQLEQLKGALDQGVGVAATPDFQTSADGVFIRRFPRGSNPELEVENRAWRFVAVMRRDEYDASNHSAFTTVDPRLRGGVAASLGGLFTGTIDDPGITSDPTFYSPVAPIAEYYTIGLGLRAPTASIPPGLSYLQAGASPAAWTLLYYVTAPMIDLWGGIGASPDQWLIHTNKLVTAGVKGGIQFDRLLQATSRTAMLREIINLNATALGVLAVPGGVIASTFGSGVAGAVALVLAKWIGAPLGTWNAIGVVNTLSNVSTFEVFTVPREAPATLGALNLASTLLPIEGPGTDYSVPVVNQTTADVSQLGIQGFISQGSTKRAAGGAVLLCGASQGILPPAGCVQSWQLVVSNTHQGSGTLVPGQATARVELISNAGPVPVVLDAVTVPVTLVASPASGAWCGASSNFNGNTIPAGWQALTIRGGPGIVNNRIEGAQVDGGGGILSPVALPTNYTEVEVQFDGYAPRSGSGAFLQVGLRTPSVDYVSAALGTAVGAPANTLSIRSTTSQGPFGFDSQTPQSSFAYGYEAAHYTARFHDDQVTWTVAGLQTNTPIISSFTQPLPGLKLNQVEGMYLTAYQTTGTEDAWVDNFTVSCSMTPRPPPLTQPVSHYLLDGNGLDSGPNGFDGVVSGPVATTDRFGNGSAAMSFDGVDDMIDLGDRFDQLTDLSITAWVELDAECALATRICGVVEKHLPADNSQKSFVLQKGQVNSVTNHWGARYYHGGTSFTDAMSVSPPPQAGRWTHLATTFGPGTATLYVDGQVVASSAVISTVIQNTLISTLIGNNEDGSHPFKGGIDDVRVYDRVISQPEVKSLCDAGGWVCGGSTPPPAPVVTTRSETNLSTTSFRARGTVTANGSPTQAWFEWDTNPALSSPNSTTPQSISSGATNFDFDQLISGLNHSTDYYYRAVASNAGGIDRGAVEQVTTPGIQLPDLVATSFENRTFYARGFDLQYNLGVTNTGGPMTAQVQFGARVYLSTDSNITSSDILIGTLPGGGQLGGGTGVTLSGTVNVPTSVSPGNYYIGVIVDPNDWVPEEIETNNAVADRIVNVVP